MKFDSIRWRLILSYVLLTLLTVTLVGVLTLTLLGESIRSQTRSQMKANAEAIADQAAALMEPTLQLNALNEMVRTLSFLSSTRIRILDAQKNDLIDSGSTDLHTSVMWVPSVSDLHGDPSYLIPISPGVTLSPLEQEWMNELRDGQDTLVIRVDESPWGRKVVFEQSQSEDDNHTKLPTDDPHSGRKPSRKDSLPEDSVRVPIGDAKNPTGYVQLESPGSGSSDALDAMRRALLWAGLGTGVIAVIAGLLVSRSLTAPLHSLAETATEMSGGNLAARAPLHGAEEIRRLAMQFNHMAESLQASFSALSAERDALRRFIADASHELRTPVTALSSFIELLQGPAAGDIAAREEFLAESQTQVRRMQWITANLLDLSRLDAGLVQLERQPLDLGELLLASAAPFRPRADDLGVRLDVEIPAAPVTLHADRARIEMAISNLLDNALKFTPAGGQVILSGRGLEADAGARISVADSGPGIPAEDLPHIFERFYRGRTTQKGSGLGLSIVHSVVQLHGGQVQVENLPTGGARFNILL